MNEIREDDVLMLGAKGGFDVLGEALVVDED